MFARYPDDEPGHRGAEANALERGSEEGEATQYHSSFYQRDPDHYYRQAVSWRSYRPP
jgi:hypothetical protein